MVLLLLNQYNAKVKQTKENFTDRKLKPLFFFYLVCVVFICGVILQRWCDRVDEAILQPWHYVNQSP